MNVAVWMGHDGLLLLLLSRAVELQLSEHEVVLHFGQLLLSVILQKLLLMGLHVSVSVRLLLLLVLSLLTVSAQCRNRNRNCSLGSNGVLFRGQ